MTISRISRTGVLLMGLALAAAACGPSGSSSAPTTAGSTAGPATPPAASTAALSGEVEVGGSSTVFLISEAVSEEFQLANSGVTAPVAIDGTGGGFERFCQGELDVTGASRAIKSDDEDEIPVCTANNIEYLELQVALDGISVIVDIANSFADCFTVDELRTIYAPDSPEGLTWSDVRAGWPAEPVNRFSPDAESGTFDFFTAEINGEEGAGTSLATPYSLDTEAVTGVSGDQYAIAYFGHGYVEPNADKIRAVPVDGGSGCIEPTNESILDGTYAPLSRPLFIYPNIGEAKTRPELAAYIHFYMDNTNVLSPEVGFVAMPDDLLATEQAELDGALP